MMLGVQRTGGVDPRGPQVEGVMCLIDYHSRTGVSILDRKKLEGRALRMLCRQQKPGNSTDLLGPPTGSHA